jgi:hypothetical protein
MKILAIEKEAEEVDWQNAHDILKEEARQVYQLYLSDTLREIYFMENKTTILILETANKTVAEELLQKLPLVKAGFISFEVMELRPYRGYDRLIKGICV